jgi:hypothetical protein
VINEVDSEHDCATPAWKRCRGGAHTRVKERDREGERGREKEREKEREREKGRERERERRI